MIAHLLLFKQDGIILVYNVSSGQRKTSLFVNESSDELKIHSLIKIIRLYHTLRFTDSQITKDKFVCQ